MKVTITTLTHKGLEISYHLDMALIQSRMDESSFNDIEFTENPEYNVTIWGRAFGAELKGEVRATINRQCNRCSEIHSVKLNVPLKFYLKPKPTDYPEWTDDGILYFTGDQADIDIYIEETLILAIPLTWNPDQSCNTTIFTSEKPVTQTLFSENLLKNLKKD
jgi:hypothetical protein